MLGLSWAGAALSLTRALQVLHACPPPCPHTASSIPQPCALLPAAGAAAPTASGQAAALGSSTLTPTHTPAQACLGAAAAQVAATQLCPGMVARPGQACCPVGPGAWQQQAKAGHGRGSQGGGQPAKLPAGLVGALPGLGLQGQTCCIAGNRPGSWGRQQAAAAHALARDMAMSCPAFAKVTSCHGPDTA